MTMKTIFYQCSAQVPDRAVPLPDKSPEALGDRRTTATDHPFASAR